MTDQEKTQANPLSPKNWGLNINNMLLSICAFFLLQLYLQFNAFGKTQQLILETLARVTEQVKDNDEDIKENKKDIRQLMHDAK